MKKFIKFTLSTKKTFTIPFEQAQEILNSQAQVVMISKDGEWDGETINKSFLISTERDIEAEKQYKMYDEKKPQIEEHRPDIVEIKDMLARNRPAFLDEDSVTSNSLKSNSK